MPTSPVILVTDDESSIRKALKEILSFENYQVIEAENGRRALEVLAAQEVNLVLLDIKMPGMDGIEVMAEISKAGYEMPVIMLSGHGNIETAVQATKLGAYDFLSKPPDLNRLLITVRNALERHVLSRSNKTMRRKIGRMTEIIGESAPMQSIKQTIRKVAATDARVLITGENGTGKELVARWLHELSKRSHGPFVEVNCAAIPADLLESELFGHEKGAFTGAVKTRIGKFEQADGGTIFLDEIGDMPPAAQAKVLRVLQENVLVRVGGNESIPVDVRVLAATNKDLQEEIHQGRFREDLYHRLSVILIHVPPLRERTSDIPLLATHFLEQLADSEIAFAGKQFSESALQKLKTFPWTGNVRELRNVVERLAILSEGTTIDGDAVDLLAKPKTRPAKSGGKWEELVEATNDFAVFKEEAERLFLLRKLEQFNWNISQTADAIGIQRSHLYTKMKRYDIDR
jgi:DNA-binding NtrC family response regulator